MNKADQAEFKKRFTPAEWAWLMKDDNCRNVINGDTINAALFYCQFRLPRRLKTAAFWND